MLLVSTLVLSESGDVQDVILRDFIKRSIVVVNLDRRSIVLVDDEPVAADGAKRVNGNDKVVLVEEESSLGRNGGRFGLAALDGSSAAHRPSAVWG